MTEMHVTPFESTVHTTNVWLKELSEELEWTDHHRAYHALRTVLHALRDLLTIEEVADLGAQLPMLIRGLYYEGWNPNRKPPEKRKRETFLDRIREAFPNDPAIYPEAMAWSVFKILQKHVSAGEIKDIKHVLPKNVRVLLPGGQESI
jgi:uncharacterized protein (DUF2267 family)